jgi:hypothetical protein
MKSLENYFEQKSQDNSFAETAAHPFDQMIKKREL